MNLESDPPVDNGNLEGPRIVANYAKRRRRFQFRGLRRRRRRRNWFFAGRVGAIGCPGTIIEDVPMRQDCKYFESRTYPSGDTVRKCDLDLAPEAPWRCPDDCPKYERRLADVNWSHGTLITPPTPSEPPRLGEDDSIAALLDEAEDIVNAAGPDIRAEVEAERDAARRGGRGRLRSFFDRRKK